MEIRDQSLLDRFLRYVKVDTQSSTETGTHPSTEKQLDLARMVAQELEEMGASGVTLTRTGYVYATLPATPGREKEESLGFLAHLDTSPDASGRGVKPSVITYGGGIVPLGESGRTLDPALFPFLEKLVGKTLVVTDGTTLLGADDKAGVAIIMTLAETLLKPDAMPHGEVRLAFTPDEEIGEGTANFEVERFGARRAYTFDGGEVDTIENANFNAAHATFKIRGVSVHPGSAKGVMVNAVRIAAEIIGQLPQSESPEQTEGKEGFFHPDSVRGSVSEATVDLIIRDHDAELFTRRKERIRTIAQDLNNLYGAGTVTVRIADQYRNMEDILKKHPGLVEAACEAIREQGLEPKIKAIRGGTDGATLSYLGVPCPNLGTGGRNCHGEMEFAVFDEMRTALSIGLSLACGKRARS